MARFTGGWVKLYRKAALGDINSNYVRGGLFQAILSMANIQSSTVDWRGVPRSLERGEIVTSLKELAELGDVDTRTVLKHLNYLRVRETISFEKSTRGMLIKINNYQEYQGLDAERSGEHAGRGRLSMQNGMQEGVTHIEERKNKRKKEECDSLKKSFDHAYSLYRQNFPETTKGPKAFERFVDQFGIRGKMVDEILLSIPNYAQHLKEVEKKQGFKKAPKQTFATYLGTQKSGYFWEDHIPDSSQAKPSAYKEW
jgi:hypothetical protein